MQSVSTISIVNAIQTPLLCRLIESRLKCLKYCGFWYWDLDQPIILLVIQFILEIYVWGENYKRQKEGLKTGVHKIIVWALLWFRTQYSKHKTTITFLLDNRYQKWKGETLWMGRDSPAIHIIWRQHLSHSFGSDSGDCVHIVYTKTWTKA
jgi:hypothetical protein